MKVYIILLAVLFVFCSCKGNKQTTEVNSENSRAKELFQGIWLDDDSETILLKVQGDTIYYADPQNAPVYFKIICDSLYMYGNDLSRYKIDKQTEHVFWFHSFTDDVVKLHKSENESDSLAFANKIIQVIPTYTEFTKRDTVVMYKGTRYRAYVYINPSKMKVIRTSYSENGISVDNVYYDNVMHICIYEGKKSLFASDITKPMFKGIVPEEFLEQAVLSEIEFVNIDGSGYHYRVTICIPETLVCYMVNLNISFDGKLEFETVK